jgi:hypothetical protein
MSRGRMNATQRRRKLRRLLERDGVVYCWSCGERIDRRLPPDDDWAISIDHVVRLADGGGHDLSNLKHAHRVCNTLRDLARKAA